MTPTAYIAHHVAGRTRLRIPDKRGDSHYFETVRRTLSSERAIECLKVNPETASVLLHHHQGSMGPIAAAADRQGLFRIVGPASATPSRPVPVRTSTATSLSALDAGATGLSGLALVQLARGQAFGSAIENFWNAYGAKRFLHRPDIVVLFAAIGIYQVLSGRYLGSATSLLFYSMVTRQLAASERQMGTNVRTVSVQQPEPVPRGDAKTRAEVIFPSRS